MNISSSQISFAKKNDKEEVDDDDDDDDDGGDLKKDIPVSSIDKTKKINRDSKEKTEVQNYIMNDIIQINIISVDILSS